MLPDIMSTKCITERITACQGVWWSGKLMLLRPEFVGGHAEGILEGG